MAEMATKQCRKCDEVKPRTDFYKSHDGAKGPVLKSICKTCHTAQVREWYGRNTDRSNTNRRRLQLKNDYGLTLEQYEAMLVEQGGVCAICKEPERARRNGKLYRLPVDHDHATGRVRGLLCHACNRAIGLLQEDISLLQRAIDYLLEHQVAAVDQGGQ